MLVAATAVGFDRLREALAEADVVVACTASGESVVTLEDVQAAHQPGRALLIVDIAVPRAVARPVAALDDVTVLDLDDLRDWADRGLALRAGEAEHAMAIVDEELERFSMELTARQAAPLVARLHERPSRCESGELERFANRLAALDEDQRDAVDALTHAIVAKLLHEPSVRLRHDAGTPQGERNAAAVSDLFDLH